MYVFLCCLTLQFLNVCYILFEAKLEMNLWFFSFLLSKLASIENLLRGSLQKIRGGSLCTKMKGKGECTTLEHSSWLSLKKTFLKCFKKKFRQICLNWPALRQTMFDRCAEMKNYFYTQRCYCNTERISYLNYILQFIPL